MEVDLLEVAMAEMEEHMSGSKLKILERHGDKSGPPLQAHHLAPQGPLDLGVPQDQVVTPDPLDHHLGVHLGHPVTLAWIPHLVIGGQLEWLTDTQLQAHQMGQDHGVHRDLQVYGVLQAPQDHGAHLDQLPLDHLDQALGDFQVCQAHRVHWVQQVHQVHGVPQGPLGFGVPLGLQVHQVHGDLQGPLGLGILQDWDQILGEQKEVSQARKVALMLQKVAHMAQKVALMAQKVALMPQKGAFPVLKVDLMAQKVAVMEPKEVRSQLKEAHMAPKGAHMAPKAASRPFMPQKVQKQGAKQYFY